jgi:hypothetical protein
MINAPADRVSNRAEMGGPRIERSSGAATFPERAIRSRPGHIGTGRIGNRRLAVQQAGGHRLRGGWPSAQSR